MTPYLKGYADGAHLRNPAPELQTGAGSVEYERGYVDGWKDRQLHEAKHSRNAPPAPSAPSLAVPVTNAAANAQMARDNIAISHFMQEMDRGFRETVYNPPQSVGGSRAFIGSIPELMAYVGYNIGWFRRAHGGLK